MSEQENKEELIKLINLILKSNLGEEIINSKAFIEFLNVSNVSFVKVLFFQNNKEKYEVVNSESKISAEPHNTAILFYKTIPKQLSFEDFFELTNFSVCRSSDFKLIFNELDYNIIPKIKLNFKDSNNLVGLVEGFKEKLSGIEQRMFDESNSHLEETNFDLIYSPLDEVNFWKIKKNTSQREELIYTSYIEPLKNYFLQISNKGNQPPEVSLIKENNAFKIFDKVFFTLFDLSKNSTAKFLPLRLRHFTNLICDYFAWQLGVELSKLDLSDNSSLQVLLTINNALKHASYRVDQLNSILRQSSSEVIYTSTELHKLHIRVMELIEIKGLINETSKLIDTNNLLKVANQLNSDSSMSFHSGSSLIDDIKLQINTEINNLESQILANIDQKIFKSEIKENTNINISTEHVVSILREMSNYKSLFQRKNIQQKTLNYREHLLNQLIKYISNLKEYFDVNNQETFEETNNLILYEKIPEISSKVSVIIFGYSLKQKIESAKKLASVFLKDLSNYNELSSITEKLLSKVSIYITDSISDWQVQFSNINELLPKSKNTLLEVHPKTGFLKVNFSDELFTLISDVRVLIEYDYADKISKDILKIYDEGKKIHKEAISLKQIANFYNTISSQVIEAQRPMLVNCAKSFEDNIKYLTQKSKFFDKNSNDRINNSNQVNFDLENFVTLVQTASADLTREIRKIKQAHSDILELIIQLLNYDLISNKGKWKENLKKARNILTNCCESFSDDLTIEWKNHWNFQLYKVLKIQYSLSLEKFFQFVTEIDCNVSIKHKQLTMDPSSEELKKSVFREIKSFISIPSLIQGFTNECNYYSNLLEENNSKIVDLYSNVNVAIRNFEIKIEELNSYTGLLQINYDTFAENYLLTFNDWKRNLDELINIKKEISRFDDMIKIDCFKINLTGFKEYFENTFDFIFEKMGESLKDKLNFNVKQIDEFVKDAFTNMNKKASSMQEVLEFKQNFGNISRKKIKYLELCQQTDEMNKLVFKLTGGSLNLTTLSSKWKDFETMIGSYSSMLEEQKDEIKNEMFSKMSGLNDRLEKFYSKFQSNRLDSNYMPDKDTDLKELANGIKNNYLEFSEIEKEIQIIINDCKNFDLELPDLSSYDRIKDDLNYDKQKWTTFFDFNEEFLKMQKEEWLGIRHKAFGLIQDFVLSYSDKMKKRQNKDFIYMHIMKELNTVRESLNVYKFLIGDNFERDHWKTLFNLLKIDNKVTKESLLFGHFLEKTDLLVQKQNDIRNLYTRAQGEILIRNSMSELMAWFESAEFIFLEYTHNNQNKDNTKVKNKVTPLIKEWKDMMNEISEKQSLLITIKSSEYFVRFQEQIEQFEFKFSSIDTWLTQLNHIQRKWIYLEPIFARGALPKEAQRFKKIDDEFRSIMLNLFNNNKVQTFFNIPNVKDTLLMLIDQLEKCQKALNDYLEDKRNKFARLYFLGDDDLLEFLAKATDSAIIKNNLKKLFQGISNIKIELVNGKENITEMHSSINEIVNFSTQVTLTEELEKWLNCLTEEMRTTLKINLVSTLKKFSDGNNMLDSNSINYEYLDKTCSQNAGIVEMVMFTMTIENAIKSGNLKKLLGHTIGRIDRLSILQSTVGSKLSKEKRTSYLFMLKNLMLDIIHNREIVELLLSTGVNNLTEWDWYRQLKYFYNSNSSDPNQYPLTIGMCDGIYNYTFEYQGAGQKLVHTSLTDKCYITLTQALRLGYGGNPYGPAGTGKTESVKALGQAFGRQVLVFNCDEGIDFKAMGRIFIGITKSGAWGCFDEFNRLLEEQLSAISIQIQLIHNAIKQKTVEINLLNINVEVNFESAIFVTLNPASKAYGGRSKLPDNLKMLFRPVAMSVPDNQQIARTLMYAEGFKNSDILAKKVVSLFALCKQGLSYQKHYDWGLRSLKTILTVANQQIQNIINSNTGKEINLNLTEETEILIKSIRINILSKLNFADSKKFFYIINDVFPDIKNISDIEYKDLNTKLLQAYKDNGLEIIDSQFKKVVQFHESLKQKMGVVLVGPSGCGKTSIWSLLKDAYAKMGIQVVTKIVNPKSMPRNQLLGYMNHDTGEYFYGVLTKNAKDVEKEPLSTLCWIICDGDVDPEWIEALNSVLDDNRLLTMQNGERISFTSNINFIFETDSLKYASPATISRLGIIYMNQEDLTIEAIIKSYIQTVGSTSESEQSEEVSEEINRQKNNLDTWFENFFFEAFSLLIGDNLSNSKSDYHLMLKSTYYGMIHNFLSLMCNYSIECLDSNVNNSELVNPQLKINKNICIVNSKGQFVDLVIKGLSAFLNKEERKKFATEVYSLTGERFQFMTSNPINVFYDNSSNSFKEFLFDDSEKLDIKDFSNLNTNPIIKTPSIQRDFTIINSWFALNEPFVIVGPEGSGKSLLINYLLSQKKSSLAVINSTSQSNSKTIIQKLYQLCTINNTSKGKILRPKDANKLVLLIKNINLPKPDKYETIQLLTFLQQIVTFGGFYSEDLDFIYLERIQIICSMNPSSTLGRFEVSTRLTGKIKMLYVDYPSEEEILLIYKKYLESILEYFDDTIRTSNNLSSSQKSNLGYLNSFAKQLAQCSINVFNNISKKINVQESVQCSYTPRDLSNWIINLLRYEESICLISNNNNNIINENFLISLIEVWAYEACRVFRDKLNSKELKDFFERVLQTEINSFISTNKSNISSFNSGTPIQNININIKHLNYDLTFSSFESGLSPVMNSFSLLNKITKEDFIEQANKGQLIFERDNQDLNIVVNDELLYNLKLIDRVISRTNSNLLLLGKSGVGRKKYVRLAAANKHFEFFSSSLFINFSKNEFKKDLKQICQLAGVEGKNLIFFVEEHHLNQSSEMIEYVNSLLSSGEIPGMLNNEDIDSLLSSLNNEFKEQTECKSIYDLLIFKVKKYLKIVIVIDYDHKDFNTILSNNPAFITYCDVVWFENYEAKTNKEIISNELTESYSIIEKSNNVSNVGKILTDIFLDIFNSLTEVSSVINGYKQDVNSKHLLEKYNSVLNYTKQIEKMNSQQKLIELILTFKSLIKLKMSDSTNKIHHLKSGLAKLEEAEKFVEILSVKSEAQQKEITEKKNEANAALQHITQSMQLASTKRSSLEKLNNELAEEARVVQENKAVIENELSYIMPQVEAAKLLVGKLDSSKLAELRVYFAKDILKPEVYSVLKATLSILGHINLNSQGVKTTFKNDTINSLINLDLNRLNPDNMKAVQKVVAENPMHFDPNNATRVNYALGQIAKYVKAMIDFGEAKQKIQPLEVKLNEAEAKMAQTKKHLDGNTRDVQKIDKKVEEYKKDFEVKTQKAEELKYELNLTLDKLEKANSLLKKLTNEKIRWKEQIEEISYSNDILPYNCVLSSAVVVFLGYFNESVREYFVDKWSEIIINIIQSNKTNISIKRITEFLTNESETLKLKAEGLPADHLSLENALILKNGLSKKTKLIIDPVEKATEWFKSYYLLEGAKKGSKESKNVDVMSISDKKLLTNLELAVRFGKEILITEIDKVEPILIPLIRRETLKVGARSVIKVGEKTVDFNENFNLYLATRDNSIELSSSLLSSLLIVNFTVTRSGLESLLLALTIEMEQPELEIKKNELLEQQARIKIELADVEKMLLDELVKLDGNLLENKNLIITLEEAKDKSIKSEESLKESLRLTLSIDEKRNIYLSLSILATDIFMLLKDLFKLNPMYRYSLNSYIKEFKNSLKETNSKHSTNPNKLNQFKEDLIKYTFAYYSRSLFKADLLVFGLYFVKNIIFTSTSFNGKGKSETDNLLWEFILGNLSSKSNEAEGKSNSNVPNIIPNDRRELFSSFQKVFTNEVKAINWGSNEIKSFITKEKISNEDLRMVVQAFTSKISCNPELLGLIFTQVTRPDQLETIMKDFVCSQLKINSLVPKALTLSEILSKEDFKTPILYTTALGSDPSKDIEELALKEVGLENFVELPIGAGESEKVIQNIRDAVFKGKWIVLKNVHLSISLLKLIEKELKSFFDNQNLNINPNYKLFLTSEPHSKFSVVLLENCLKLSYETPPGIKKNLERIYQNWDSNIFSLESSYGKVVKDSITQQSLFSIALLHALLQERRTYIPQGWTKFYEFSFSDLKVTYETLLEFMTNSGNTNSLWKNLKGLIKITFYGGRIDNDFDLEVMNTYVDLLINPDKYGKKGDVFLKFFKVLSSSSSEDYKKLISELDDSDSPLLFGLPNTVERSVQRFVSSETILKMNSLYSIATENGESMKFDKELWISKLSPIINLWKQLFNFELLSKTEQVLNGLSNNNTIEADAILSFLKTETENSFNLINKINEDICLIENVLFNNSIMTSEINICSLTLLKGITPEYWQKLWEGSEIPQNYLKSVLKKVEGILNYSSSTKEITKVSLFEFLYPESFLNAFKQKATRKLKKAIDELVIKCSFTKPNAPSGHIEVRGLLLQGCEIANGGLVENTNEHSEIISIDSLFIYFEVESQDRESKDSLTIPLYENIFREKIICKLNFNIKGLKEDFILKGVALCLEA